MRISHDAHYKNNIYNRFIKVKEKVKGKFNLRLIVMSLKLNDTNALTISHSNEVLFG